jgi:hypothetical protein
MSILDSWSGRLTRWRDIALIGFAAIYALGYFTRAVHAWLYNLGVLPGVELQYFAAGLLLFVPPAAVVAALFGLWKGLQRVASWERRRPGVRRRIDNVLTVLVLVGMLGTVLVDGLRRWIAVPQYMSGVFIGAFVLGFGVNIALAMARPEPPTAVVDSERRGRGVVRVLGWIGRALGGILVVNLGLLFALLILMSILIGALKWLPELPQSLGGGAPRCAYFDVDVTKVSPELINELFEPAPSRETAVAAKGARRSRQVLVYHSGGDYVLFKLPGTPSAGPTYELKRSAVDAVLWCR